MAGVSVSAIRFAELRMPYAYAFRAPGPRWRSLLQRGEPLPAPCLAFLLRHPDAGVILVDTGLHPDAHASVRRDVGPAMGLMFAGLRAVGPPFGEALRQAGVQPEEVERVVMTHLHVDPHQRDAPAPERALHPLAARVGGRHGARRGAAGIRRGPPSAG